MGVVIRMYVKYCAPGFRLEWRWLAYYIYIWSCVMYLVCCCTSRYYGLYSALMSTRYRAPLITPLGNVLPYDTRYVLSFSLLQIRFHLFGSPHIRKIPIRFSPVRYAFPARHAAFHYSPIFHGNIHRRFVITAMFPNLHCAVILERTRCQHCFCGVRCD